MPLEKAGIPGFFYKMKQLECKQLDMKFYQFTKDIKPGFVEFCKIVMQHNATVCFDFEDSICYWEEDVDKEQHRNRILHELDRLKPEISYGVLGFRINPVHSEVYRSDIAALNSIYKVKVVFIPKIEEKDDLKKVLKDIHCEADELIPIVETEKGFKNIDHLLQVKDHRIKNIAFGHCDFNLSMGLFPFKHQNSPAYWKWIDHINKQCIRYGIGLINSPVLELGNDRLLIDTLKHAKTYPAITGQITLCRQQTLTGDLINRPEVINETITEQVNSDNQVSSRATRGELIILYEKYKITGKSFAVTPDKKLISPQEYEAALQDI